MLLRGLRDYGCTEDLEGEAAGTDRRIMDWGSGNALRRMLHVQSVRFVGIVRGHRSTLLHAFLLHLVWRPA